MESGPSIYKGEQDQSKKQPNKCDEGMFKKYFNSLTSYSSSLFLGVTRQKFYDPQTSKDNEDLWSVPKNIPVEKNNRDFNDFLNNFIKLCGPTKFLDIDTSGKDPITYLQFLFINNLSWVAEEIGNEIVKNGFELPYQYKILIDINNGKNLNIDSNFDNNLFTAIAYRVANDAGNMEMVEKLYTISGTEERSNQLKKNNPQTYSLEVNYIHEPYWSYNLVQLRDYGQRIIKKMTPYFIEQSSLIKDQEKLFVKSGDSVIEVVKTIFGNVLPNLYLKKQLDGSKDRAVPRLFIIPKEKTITFKFKMPCKGDEGDSGNNQLQVLSESFDIYQEYIEGEGSVGDKSFLDLGQRDFNAVQMASSKQNGKKYLFDTKEQKNFFIPIFEPFTGVYKTYNLPGIENNEQFMSWKKKNQAIIYQAKELNFDIRVRIVNISVNLEN